MSRPWPRRLAGALALAVVAGVAVQAARDTLREPVQRSATLPLPGLPPASGTAEVRAGGFLRVLLLSDIHVAGPDMPPERLTRIVETLNALHPDIVAIAGDFISDKWLSTRHYPLDQALAPLAGLHSRWGTVAVLGNHDYIRGADATRAALERLGIRVLRNQAMRVGPVTLGGMGDASMEDANHTATIAAMRALPPPYIMLAHEPDAFARLPGDMPLMLAGHTHCGQIALPLIGPIVTGSHYGRRYVCGLVREHGSALIVTAGLGTSDLPFRLGVPGDVWLITLTPAPLAMTATGAP